MDSIAPKTANLLPALIIHHQQRDVALKLGYPGKSTRELAYHYERQQLQTAQRVTRAAFLNLIIQTGAIEIKNLIAQVTNDNAHEVLKKVRQIETKVKKAHKELKCLM